MIDCFEDHRCCHEFLHSTDNPPCLSDFLQQKRYWAESRCVRGHFLGELYIYIYPQFCLLHLCVNQIWTIKCAAIWQLFCSSCTTKSKLVYSIYKLKSFGWLLDLKLMAHLEGPLVQRFPMFMFTCDVGPAQCGYSAVSFSVCQRLGVQACLFLADPPTKDNSWIVWDLEWKPPTLTILYQ